MSDLPDDWDADDHRDGIEEHPPDTDIDQYHEVDHFRVERMGADGLWVAAWADHDAIEHHYDISCGPDGLSITHRREYRDRS